MSGSCRSFSAVYGPNAGTYAGNVITYVLANNGSYLASNYSISTSTATAIISPLTLTIASTPIVNNKFYDGLTTSASVTVVGSATGYFSGESLNITATATNYGPNVVGSPYTATITYHLADKLTYKAINYTIATTTASATIVPKGLTPYGSIYC